MQTPAALTPTPVFPSSCLMSLSPRTSRRNRTCAQQRAEVENTSTVPTSSAGWQRLELWLGMLRQPANQPQSSPIWVGILSVCWRLERVVTSACFFSLSFLIYNMGVTLPSCEF